MIMQTQRAARYSFTVDRSLDLPALFQRAAGNQLSVVQSSPGIKRKLTQIDDLSPVFRLARLTSDRRKSNSPVGSL